MKRCNCEQEPAPCLVMCLLVAVCLQSYDNEARVFRIDLSEGCVHFQCVWTLVAIQDYEV